MEVRIDTGSGFCFGVTSAIKKAEEELQHGQLYCLGDIVHNGQEVERLAKLGLQTINNDDLRRLHNVRVLLRAHGEPPATYKTAADNGIEIIDASCPVVKRLQDRIRSTFEAHPAAQIVIFGKPGHAEVIGLQGQTDNRAVVIENTAGAAGIDCRKDIYLFSQTTKSVEDFLSLVEAIKRRREALPEEQRGVFEWHDTICRNVAGRVAGVQTFARQNDIVVFVGGRKSSNAQVLFARCRDANTRTVFVSGESELTPAWIRELNIGADTKIGICGATSTPLWLMEKCKSKIEELWNMQSKQSGC